MKQFLKNNGVLIAGIVLPLALMLVFHIAEVATRASVADPQYDLVFSANGYGDQSWHVGVENEQLVIRYTPPKTPPAGYVPPKPQLYRLDHRTMTASLLNINYDHVVDGVVQDPAIDEINKNSISTTAQSPDGYQLIYDYNYHSGIFPELFGFGYEHSSNILRKGARNIPVKADGVTYYISAQLVGWILGPKT